MKNMLSILTALGLLLSLTQKIAAQNETATDISINGFEFLIGKWEADFGKFKYYEEWQKENNRFSGQGYRIKEGQIFNGEKLLLINIHGYISYIATVGKQQPILFALTESSENKYVFENKEHDFPQRIIYNVIGENNIKVSVEGDLKGKTAKDEYNMTRITE